MSAPLYRWLRVLEYTGTMEALNDARERRGVKGTFVYGGKFAIRESFIGETPQVLDCSALRAVVKELQLAAKASRPEPVEDVRLDGYLQALKDVLEVLP